MEKPPTSTDEDDTFNTEGVDMKKIEGLASGLKETLDLLKTEEQPLEKDTEPGTIKHYESSVDLIAELGEVADLPPIEEDKSAEPKPTA